MGMLRSHNNQQGLVVNSVILGDPGESTHEGVLMFVWDHQQLPTGELHADSTITLDVFEVI